MRDAAAAKTEDQRSTREKRSLRTANRQRYWRGRGTHDASGWVLFVAAPSPPTLYAVRAATFAIGTQIPRNCSVSCTFSTNRRLLGSGRYAGVARGARMNSKRAGLTRGFRVVEHDVSVIRHADWIVDAPGRGLMEVR